MAEVFVDKDGELVQFVPAHAYQLEKHICTYCKYYQHIEEIRSYTAGRYYKCLDLYAPERKSKSGAVIGCTGGYFKQIDVREIP